MKVGRKIFYDNITGNPLVDTGQWDNVVRDKTVDEEIESYTALSERNLETFDVVKLEYGQHQQNFAKCNGYWVNPETKELEFSYPDPADPEAPPIYGKPLTDQMDELKQENILLKAQNNAISERADFIEDIIAEMAMVVYT